MYVFFVSNDRKFEIFHCLKFESKFFSKNIWGQTAPNVGSAQSEDQAFILLRIKPISYPKSNVYSTENHASVRLRIKYLFGRSCPRTG